MKRCIKEKAFGKEFQYRGRILKVVKPKFRDSSCFGCAFYNNFRLAASCPSKMLCKSRFRKDKRDIIYIVIDKGDKKNERFNKHKTI